jgi:hypothetical protein
MVYELTDVANPTFVGYVTNAPQDESPEGLKFVEASKSPSGKPLLLVAHEVSGTTTIYEIDDLIGGTTAGSTTAGTTSGDTTSGTTTVGTTTSGATAATTTAGATTAGTTAGTTTTGATTAGSATAGATGGAFTLPWNITVKKPKTKKPIKFKAGKKGIGTVQGIIDGISDLNPKVEGVQVELAIIAGSGSATAGGSTTGGGTTTGGTATGGVTTGGSTTGGATSGGGTVVNFVDANKVGKVSKKNKVKFKAKKFGASLDLTSGQSFQLVVRATRPGLSFDDSAVRPAYTTNTYTVK